MMMNEVLQISSIYLRVFLVLNSRKVCLMVEGVGMGNKDLTFMDAPFETILLLCTCFWTFVESGNKNLISALYILIYGIVCGIWLYSCRQTNRQTDKETNRQIVRWIDMIFRYI